MKLPLAAAAAALVLAGCAGVPGANQTITERQTVTAAPAPAPAPAPESDDETFIRILVGQDSSFATVPERDLIDVAGSICSLLDEGFSASTLGEVAMDSGLSMQQAAALVAASIVVYCPWHENNV